MYLFIFEDGTLSQQKDPPSEEESKQARDGYVQILTAAEGHFEELTRDGEWKEVSTVEKRA